MRNGELMSAGQTLDLGACEREAIHVPGYIQPHGLLFAVDQTTDLILQAAGDAKSLVNFSGVVLGNTLERVLGIPLAGLLVRARGSLGREPIYLGAVGPFANRKELIVTGHQVGPVAIVELQPSIRPMVAADAFTIIRLLTERIGVASDDLIQAFQFAACEVRRITGYDRVMIYQFLPDGTGSVIAEVKDAHLSPFLNHRYPASDIPRQARELYRRSPIRTIPDVGYTPTAITPTLSPQTNQPLDMSHCVLRSVSQVHVQYLKNMGVGASMSVSLLPHGELWGLIACHNTTAKLLSFEAQETCRHIGQILSQQIRTREESAVYRVEHDLTAGREKIMLALSNAGDPGALLFHLCTDIQSIVPSHGVAVARKGRIVTAGHVPTKTQILQLAAWLNQPSSDINFFATDCLSKEYPKSKAFSRGISGLLSIVLPGNDPTIIIWFRAEQVEEINWAGNPHEPLAPDSRLGSINPRKSFATWRQTVSGRSRPWETVEIDSALAFRLRATFVLQQQTVRELNRLLSEANESLRGLASTDGLTGIANRRAFDECLQKEWVRSGRPPYSSLAIVILDLDFFKQYNDHYGHGMGDACLKRVAQVLRGNRRAADLAARIGGEEFSIVLPATDIQGAVTVAETLRKRIEALQLEHMGSSMGVVTASFGVAVAVNDSIGKMQNLLNSADKALYRAKENGRNRVVSI